MHHSISRFAALGFGLLTLALVACTAPAATATPGAVTAAAGTATAAPATTGAAAPTATTSAPKTVTTAVTTPGGGAPKTFTDPVAYCTAVGTIDRPDARFTGPAVPPAIIAGLVRADGNSNATPTAQQTEFFSRGTIWRCMGGLVYACSVGANIPCDVKANTNRNPAGTPMATFCTQNPNSQFVPGAAMDRSSVFEWTCRNGQAEVVRQVSQVDASGYPTNFWTRINPT